MNNYKFSFKNIPWDTTTTGAMQKLISLENQNVRKLKLDDTYAERGWCTNAHIGYVLKGGFVISYNGNAIRYDKGDLFHIPGGEGHKHMP